MEFASSSLLNLFAIIPLCSGLAFTVNVSTISPQCNGATLVGESGDVNQWNTYTSTSSNCRAGFLVQKQAFTLKNFYIEATGIASVTVKTPGMSRGFIFVITNMAAIKVQNSTDCSGAVYHIYPESFTGLAVIAEPLETPRLRATFSTSVVSTATQIGTTYLANGNNDNIDLTQLTTYQIRVDEDAATGAQSIMVRACAGSQCSQFEQTAKLPDALSSLGPLYFGVGAQSANDGTVSIKQVSVYSCETPTTTTTVKTTTTTESPSRKVTLNAKHFITDQELQSLYPVQDFSESSELTVEDLLKECKDFAPSRTAPPPSNANNGVTSITPIFAVDRFVGIDTVSQTITVSGIFSMNWTVTTCPKNSSDDFSQRPPEKIFTAKTEEVWTPRYRFLSSASSNYFMQNNDQFGDDLLLTMTVDEKVGNRTLSFGWLKEGLFTSTCDLDLTKFPFDIQICNFVFSLMQSTAVTNFTEPLFLWRSHDLDNDEWRYQWHASQMDLLFYRNKPCSTIYYALSVERHSNYYVTNLVLPTALLAMVETGTFVMSPSGPDRSSISVTVLLAFTVTQSGVTSNIPKTSQRVLLSDYVIAMTWLSAACTLYQMAIFPFAEHEEEKSNRGRKFSIARIFDLCAVGLDIAAIITIHIYFFVVLLQN